MSILTITNLDIVFGKNSERALPLLDQKRNRAEIKNETGLVVGVHNANLTIEEGEIFVLMGLSGSGKSSLLRAINGLNPITRGGICLEVLEGSEKKNYNIESADQNIMRHVRTQHVAMVFQKFALLPWKTVLENVAFGLEIAGVEKGERNERAMTSLELVGLKNWAHQLPKELSGGMQQRVGLARALATDASVLLMDEPFSALDPLIRTHLQQELLHLQKALSKTILFVTHDLDEALKIGSRIAIMQDGKIIQVGTAEEIVSNPKTQYVKDFVAHIDQTKLLRAKAIMTKISKLEREGNESFVRLDTQGDYKCLLDENDRPKRSICRDIEGRIIPWTLYQSGAFADNDLILGNEHLMIKDVMTAIGRTKKPMVIQDNSGKMIGAITSESILSALTNKD